MSNLLQNMLILSVCWLIALGGGVYTTFFVQPDEMERLEKAEQVARMKQAELSSLVAEMTESETRATDVVTRWNTRYKIVPRSLSSEEVIRLLNDNSGNGFDPFNITFNGLKESRDFNRFDFKIEGRGQFDALYKLIWSIENHRTLYRIEDLQLNHYDLLTDDPITKQKRLDVVVSFSFTLHAFFGGAVGLSASDSTEGAPRSVFFSETDLDTALPPVPDYVLPSPRAGMNPFHPLILDNVPPNTYQYVNMEEAELLTIVGTEAILKWNEQEYRLGIGDQVYLGQIISVDPREGKVVASLNKGGILDRIELTMNLDKLYNQARGNVQLTPAKNY